MSIMQPSDHLRRRMVASRNVIKVGPWGGRAGNPWDDGPHRGIRSITVTYSPVSVDSIRVEYVDSYGRPIHGEKHGVERIYSHSVKIDVDFPYEFLTGVSGCYREKLGSLTFATSRGTVHGPFGVADGVPFSYSTMEGFVVAGFFGRHGWYLRALGFYMSALEPDTLRRVLQDRGITTRDLLFYDE